MRVTSPPSFLAFEGPAQGLPGVACEATGGDCYDAFVMIEAPSIIVTTLTPAGRGAVATVAVEGAGAINAVAKLFTSASGEPLRALAFGSIAFGRWTSLNSGEEGSLAEELVVCPTSESCVEVHCHGGQAAAASVTRSLEALGALNGNAWRWAMRQEGDRIAAEARVALAQAASPHTALILLQQHAGALRREIDAIRELLSVKQIAPAADRIGTLLAREALGRHLTQPWKVVIAGPPNVGKSSLLNALLGYNRAIVFDQPGTTRDVVTCSTVLAGWPMQFSDTAGLRATTDCIEQAGIALAESELGNADLVLWVADLAKPEIAASSELPHASPGEKAMIVYNKCDLVPRYASTPDSVSVSALTGYGIQGLQAAIVQRLIPHTPGFEEAVPFTARQFTLLHETAVLVTDSKTQAARAKLEQL